MENTTNNNSNFVTDFNKSVEESNKTNHPSDETISLYSKDALPKIEMEKLRNHLEHCWHCGEVIADAEMFQQISDDVDAGILSIDVKLPSFAELKEKAFGQPAESKFSEWLKLKIQKIAAGLNQLVPQPVGFGGDQEILQSQLIKCGNKSLLVSFFIVDKNNEIEIYSSDESVIGKRIVIKDMNGEIACPQFEADDTTEDMKAVAFFEIPENITLDQIKNLEWGELTKYDE